MWHYVQLATIGVAITLFSCDQKPNLSKDDNTKLDTHKVNSSPIQESLNENTNTKPSEIDPFVPDGYTVLDTASGDLNMDSIPDMILVLDKNREDNEVSNYEDVESEERPLLILIRNKNNQLSIARRNDNTLLCHTCGGTMGDPYAGITIKNGFFSVEHYGGSSDRWTRIITYKYSKQDKEWYLHKVDTDNFRSTDPENTASSMIMTKKDFGVVKFEEFNIDRL